MKTPGYLKVYFGGPDCWTASTGAGGRSKSAASPTDSTRRGPLPEEGDPGVNNITPGTGNTSHLKEVCIHHLLQHDGRVSVSATAGVTCEESDVPVHTGIVYSPGLMQA